MTTGAAAAVEVTDLQQSIFNAPLPSAGQSATHGLPSKPSTGADQAMADPGSPGSRGTKRRRDDEDEEEEESDSDVAMEEDSDDE